MKILLDECLPIDLRHSLSTHEAHTFEWAGLKGNKNGELLDAAELAGYEVLLTMDQGVEHQQDLVQAIRPEVTASMDFSLFSAVTFFFQPG